MSALSTTVGTWETVKVRTDLHADLAARVASAQRGTGEPRRTIRAIASMLNSSNTIVVLRRDDDEV